MGPLKLILILASSIVNAAVSAQSTNGPAKPASDACPTWSSKQTISKADYFTYLRKTPKAQKNNAGRTSPEAAANFAQPRYASLVTPRIPVSENTNSATPSEKNTAQNINAVEKLPEPVEKNYVPSFQGSSQNEEPSLTSMPQTNIIEDHSTEASYHAEKSISIEKEKVKKKNKLFTLHSAERKHWLRKIYFRKKGASKCPAF